MEKNQRMENEWKELKEWYFKEDAKIDKKYSPIPKNQKDAGVECEQERHQLWVEFIDKAKSIKEKYGLK